MFCMRVKSRKWFLYGVGSYALCRVLNVARFVTCNFLVPCKYVVFPGPTHKPLKYIHAGVGTYPGVSLVISD